MSAEGIAREMERKNNYERFKLSQQYQLVFKPTEHLTDPIESIENALKEQNRIERFKLTQKYQLLFNES